MDQVLGRRGWVALSPDQMHDHSVVKMVLWKGSRGHRHPHLPVFESIQFHLVVQEKIWQENSWFLWECSRTQKFVIKFPFFFRKLILKQNSNFSVALKKVCFILVFLEVILYQSKQGQKIFSDFVDKYLNTVNYLKVFVDETNTR